MDVNTIYDRCLAEGNIIVKENIDINKAKSILTSIENELNIAKEIRKLKINTESHLFKTFYDILRELIDAFIIFDKIKILNHICLFNYIVISHPELEFDWEILDGIRKLRNKICYYGKSLSKDKWNNYDFQLNTYISTLKNLVENKIKENNNHQ